MYGFESSCADGVNQNTALLATAAAIAVGAGVIYNAVIQQQGRRRKKRNIDNNNSIELGENSYDVFIMIKWLICTLENLEVTNLEENIQELVSSEEAFKIMNVVSNKYNLVEPDIQKKNIFWYYVMNPPTYFIPKTSKTDS